MLLTTLSEQEIRSCSTNDNNQTSITKLECECNTRKERETYLLLASKQDIEILPDTLEVGGVN